MPLTYRIDTEAGIVFARGEGVITQAERLEAIRAWTGESAYAKTSRTICNFSATTSAPTLSELREIIAVMDEPIARTRPRKIAIVARRDMSFGAARQFQALLSSATAHVQIFRDETSALAWLR